MKNNPIVKGKRRQRNTIYMTTIKSGFRGLVGVAFLGHILRP